MNVSRLVRKKKRCSVSFFSLSLSLRVLVSSVSWFSNSRGLNHESRGRFLFSFEISLLWEETKEKNTERVGSFCLSCERRTLSFDQEFNNSCVPVLFQSLFNTRRLSLPTLRLCQCRMWVCLYVCVRVWYLRMKNAEKQVIDPDCVVGSPKLVPYPIFLVTSVDGIANKLFELIWKSHQVEPETDRKEQHTS